MFVLLTVNESMFAGLKLLFLENRQQIFYSRYVYNV